MNELADLGKTISIIFVVVIYICLWLWSIDHQKYCNKNALWEVLVARAFIGLHIWGIIVFFIWSWKN